MSQNSPNDQQNLTPKPQKNISPALATILAEKTKLLLKNEDIKVKTVPFDNYQFWRTRLIAVGDDLSFDFSICFRGQTILKSLEDAGITRYKEMPDACAFMKESCNVLGGAVKYYFSRHGLPAGIGTPILSRNFDQFLVREGESVSEQVYDWILSLNDVPIMKLILTLKISNIDKFNQTEFTVEKPQEETADGELDLF